jgi:hypothetical protein
MQRKNSTADDISSVIGFTATTDLCAWFGGKNLYVPLVATEDHPVARLIGYAAFKRLVAEFQGDHLAVPTISKGRQSESERFIAAMIAAGAESTEISDKTGLSYRRVQQIRVRIEASGLIELIQKPPAKSAGKKAPL